MLLSMFTLQYKIILLEKTSFTFCVDGNYIESLTSVSVFNN